MNWSHTFTLQTKPFSINRYHYADKRHKTAEARLWEETVLSLLTDETPKLKVIAEEFKKSGGCFRIRLSFLYPPHIYYNKDQSISSKTMDLSNVEKPIIDLIFKNIMDVNDKMIVEIVSQKLPGPIHAIEVYLELDPNIDVDALISAASYTEEDGA